MCLLIFDPAVGSEIHKTRPCIIVNVDPPGRLHMIRNRASHQIPNK
ncbi:MAG: hypothetical protein IT264_06860 [Saprospiraceae bacterium]|nr:hypothetical protein [Saprospiraceae bacterium]